MRPDAPRPRSALGVLLALVLAPGTLHAQGDARLGEFRRLFGNDQCASLMTPLRQYRADLQTRGRNNLQVDYMLSVCSCRQPGLTALLRLPAVYRHLTYDDHELIADAVTRCNDGTRDVAAIPAQGASVAGKGGREIVRQLSDETADMYATRVFDLDRRDAAVASLRARGYVDIVTTRTFVLTGNVGVGTLEETGRLMEEVQARMVSAFGFASPRTLVTVYLFDEWPAMSYHARAEHGVSLTDNLWAYTFPLDASISIDLSSGLGTVGHEVFHALLDQNAPYAPPWLNEGAAALFEEFRFTTGGGIEGTYRPDHWRVPHLRDAMATSLPELLAMDWRHFDQYPEMQAHHALAKFFVMYLQERGALGAVLDAYVERDLFDGASDQEILEDQVGRDLGGVRDEFTEWLGSRVGLRPPDPGGK